MVRIIVSIGALVVVGCALTGQGIPTAEELASGGANLDTLRSGRMLYVRECAGCHRYYWPGEYAADEWRSLLPEMCNRAGLGRDDTRDVTLYLMEASELLRATSPR